MKKKLTGICSWALALLLGSIAGGCSSVSKSAKPSEDTTVEKASESVAADSAVSPAPVRPHDRMIVMYGVRPSDFRKIDE